VLLNNGIDGSDDVDLGLGTQGHDRAKRQTERGDTIQLKITHDVPPVDPP
jgi:hypothetical protein